MWPPQSVNTWPTPAPLSVRATSSPPVIQSEGAGPLRTSPAVIASASEIYRLASRRASPSLRGRRSARTATSTRSPRPAGPQPRDGLPPPLPPPHPPPRPPGPPPPTALGAPPHP